MAAINEFSKRLSSYCTISLHCSTSLELPVNLNLDTTKLLLIKRGISTYTSEDFSYYIEKLQLHGTSNMYIIIGFDEVDFYNVLFTYEKQPSYDIISLSNSKRSVETTTLLFYEQLYRAYTIIQGKTYHK